MDVVQQLRSVIIPERKKLSKRELVQHYEEKQLLDRMRIFYGGPVGARRIQSKLVNPVDEDDLPSSVEKLSKWKVSKIPIIKTQCL